MGSIELPPRNAGGERVRLDDVRVMVVVGANGAGKTRLGAFLEQSCGTRAHRISAQRSLVVPLLVQPKAFEQAEANLLYGHYDSRWTPELTRANRASYRWRNDPDTHQLDDYEHLIALVFAEKAKRDHEYTEAARREIPRAHPPQSRLERLAAIWGKVMPHRELVASNDRIQAKTPGGSAYDARRMSDGERVVFYLIGQALCAPRDGVIIIDEPEIHLHRAIQSTLWDQIEQARRDCTFIYITHDLEFAATRANARRIWLRSYDGSSWTWDELGSTLPVPDALAMEVLGSRRPVLFVEGDESSLDLSIYGALFPEEHVVPRHNSHKVIEATRGMAAAPTFHHLSVRGLVDRDRRGQDEIAALKAASVAVADVAEVENLLCVSEALEAVAQLLKKPDVPGAVEAAKSAVIREFRKQISQQAGARALARIQFALNGFGPRVAEGDAQALATALDSHVKGIDVPALVSSEMRTLEDIASRSEYEAVLRYFNCKGVAAFVAGALGVRPMTYVEMVLGMLKGEPDGAVARAMRARVA